MVAEVVGWPLCGPAVGPACALLLSKGLLFACLFFIHFRGMSLTMLGEHVMDPVVVIHNCGGGCDADALRFCLGISFPGKQLLGKDAISDVVFLEFVIEGFEYDVVFIRVIEQSLWTQF